MTENILRYPITDDHNYKGVVFFQTVRDTTEALQYQNLGGNGSEEQDFNSANTTVTDGSPVSYGDACILYLPSAIQISDAAVYDNVSLGALGAITEATLNAGVGNIAGAIATAGKDEIKSFADGLVNSLGTTQAKLAGVRMASKLGDQISGAVKSSTRITTNPNVRAIFNQVPLREFSFTFKLIANSPKEALEIKKIIKYFRTELYPSDILAGSARLSLGYHFPDQFRIEFHHPAEELTPNKWSPSQVATKLKDCYLTGFNAVYNATGMGLHKDGNFTEIDVTLSFREASTLSKKDIAAGY